MRENLVGRLLNDPSVSRWVKEKYRECLERDPVDAFGDAKLLTAMLRARMDGSIERAGTIARMLGAKGR
mgnify:CR=1 FL=1